MNLTDWQYSADAIAMALHDNLQLCAVIEALYLAESGQDFNAAIWAASKLQDIVDNQGGR